MSTVYFLQEKIKEKGWPVDCLLIEADHRLGGKILSERVDDFIIEGGPDSFITQKKWGVELCRRLGLSDRLVQTHPTEKAIFVLKRGELFPFPEGFNLMIPSKLLPFLRTPLISPLGKMRMGMDLFIPEKTSKEDESIASFVRRRLGNEAVEQFAEPILAGIFAGNAEKLSIRATFPQFVALEDTYGSLIRGMRERQKQANQTAKKAPAFSLFVTLQEGLFSLIATLQKNLDRVDIVSGRKVSAVEPLEGRYRVAFGSEEQIADAVVITTNTEAAAGWTEGWDRPLSELLRQVTYVSTATVSLGFKKEAVRHPLNGFGFVVPRKEKCGIMASTWSSTKFSGRAPKEHVLIRTFLGGAHREDLIAMDDRDLIAAVRDDLRNILGIESAPVVAKVFRWIKANPQYHVGHLDLVSNIEKRCEKHAGFYLAGAGYRGVGIPDCIRQAAETAEKICQRLNF